MQFVFYRLVHQVLLRVEVTEVVLVAVAAVVVMVVVAIVVVEVIVVAMAGVVVVVVGAGIKAGEYAGEFFAIVPQITVLID